LWQDTLTIGEAELELLLSDLLRTVTRRFDSRATMAYRSRGGWQPPNLRYDEFGLPRLLRLWRRYRAHPTNAPHFGRLSFGSM